MTNTTQMYVVSKLAGDIYDSIDYDTPANPVPTTGTTAPVPTTTSTGGGKPFAQTTVGGILNMLLSNGTGIAQVITAINGNSSTITDANGQTHDITGLKSEVEKIATDKNQDVNNVLQMMALKLSSEKQANQNKKNTALYIGLGVGALALVVTGYLVTQKKSK